jgi:hypothetical protein
MDWLIRKELCRALQSSDRPDALAGVGHTLRVVQRGKPSQAVSKCQACAVTQNRIPARGSVMIIALLSLHGSGAPRGAGAGPKRRVVPSHPTTPRTLAI